MAKDPIVAEVRSARERLFVECHEDLDALLDRFQKEKPVRRAGGAKKTGVRESRLRRRTG